MRAEKLEPQIRFTMEALKTLSGCSLAGPECINVRREVDVDMGQTSWAIPSRRE